MGDAGSPPPKKKMCLEGGSASAPARTLGAPRPPHPGGRYTTRGGVTVDCEVEELLDARAALEGMVDQLDSERGCVFESSYEFPGRYARWTMGFVNPPLVLEAWGRTFTVTALNPRGGVLLPAMREVLQAQPSVAELQSEGSTLRGRVREIEGRFAEEERSRQHSIFSVVRALCELMGVDDDPQLGLYGAFGYDLTFQFEQVPLTQQRDANQRDLLLYLPDEILVIDILANASWRLKYDFTAGGASSAGLPRTGARLPYAPKAEGDLPRRRDHAAGDFARKVAIAKEEFKAGQPLRGGALADLLRAVPGAAVRGVPPPPPAQPVAVRLPPQPRRHRVPRRREPGDVCARRAQRQGVALRDVPDLGHDPPRPRRVGRRRADQADSIGQEGGVGAHDVHRRRPQRQESDLPRRLGPGDRPPADRDVLAPHPHGDCPPLTPNANRNPDPNPHHTPLPTTARRSITSRATCARASMRWMPSSGTRGRSR